MRGIILSGGSGTRLYPLTEHINKHMMPVYDKPLIYYPLSTLMLAGIKEILLIVTPESKPLYQKILRDGSHLGIEIQCLEQAHPRGLADAFIIAENFINEEPVCLILGDNIFYGTDLGSKIKRAAANLNGATIFSYTVQDPERYGIAVFDQDGHVIDLLEKPQNPPSNHAITGLYLYDGEVSHIAKSLTPSDRGELEITDLNRAYLHKNKLSVEPLGRGFTWLDAGTHDSLLAASQFVAVIEERQGLKIACPEEIAWRNQYISNDDLQKLAEPLLKSGYGQYIKQLLVDHSV